VEQPHFDRDALIAEVAKRHKILLDPDDPAFALVTINEIVLSRAIAVVEAKLEAIEQRLTQISEKQTETAKAIGESIITAAASYVAERLKDAGADLIEKVRTSIGLDQGTQQPGSLRSGSTILSYSAMTAAFAAGFVAASLCGLVI
jgi:predicted metal-dependent hydrolase